MRKLYLVLVLMIFLQGCSMSGIIPFGATPTSTSTGTRTPTATQTPTATVTPRATATPTIVRFPTRDPELPTETVAPIQLSIGGNTVTPFATPIAFAPPPTFRPGAGFALVSVADNKIFWGDCTPNKTTILAQVEDPEEAITVYIFTQVKSVKKEDYTPWTSGNTMVSHRDGSFSYIMEATEIEGHNHYKESWIRFQLVAVNIEGEEVGRTQIYTEIIFLSPCMCYEPLKGCPIPTPKGSP